jgi:hypothetical protein
LKAARRTSRAARRPRGASPLAGGVAACVLALGCGAARADRVPAGDAIADGVATEAGSGVSRDPRGFRLALSLLSGSTRADAGLSAYQWSTTPRMAWGAQALAGRGRFEIGPRLWRSSTTQRIDVPGVTASPTVRSTSLELVGRGRVATCWDARLLASASGGRLHLGYDPDQIVIPSYGLGAPIVARFTPVDEWIAGLGLGVERPLLERWTVGLAFERRIFGLDTAHRSGNVIVNARESFGDWSARLELSRLLQRR